MLPSPVRRAANLFFFLSIISDLRITRSSGRVFGASSWVIAGYDIGEDGAGGNSMELFDARRRFLGPVVAVFAVHFDEDCMLPEVILPVARKAHDCPGVADANPISQKVLAEASGLGESRAYLNGIADVRDEASVEHLGHAGLAGEGEGEVAAGVQHFEESFQGEVVPGAVQPLDLQRRYEVADGICVRHFVEHESVLTQVLEDEPLAARLARGPHQVARRHEVQAG